jgi:hypothetical protein
VSIDHKDEERERQIQPENLPQELKSLKHWVNWAALWSADKKSFSKPPMRANGRNASSTEPGDWTTLEESLAALGRDGVYRDRWGRKHHVTLDGVGLAGLERTDWVGVDLDGCVNPETGEINAAARKIVKTFDSYTEVSPSGKGLRIWVEAEKHRAWCANKGGETDIEVYDKGRFLTATGWHLEGTPWTVEKRQEALDAFMEQHAPPEAERPETEQRPYTGPQDYAYDLEGLLDKAGVVFKQASDATSERTYHIVCPWAHEHSGGDTSGTRVGQYASGATWFRCEHAHCLSAGREWPEFREKLDPESHRGVEITVGGRRLINDSTPRGDAYSKPQVEVRSRYRSLSSTVMSNDGNEDLIQSIQAISFSGREKPGPRGWIVENSIWEGHAASWFGEGGVAKSMLAMHLALTVAAEGEHYWMGFQVKTVPVLYLDFELDADEQHRRALDLAVGMGLSDIPKNFYYLSVAMLPPAQAFGLAAEECRRLGVKLIIVDSVGFALDGDSENARDVLGFYRVCIQPLKDAGASPLLIDHQAKIIKGEKYSDKQAFGSVYKTNAVRSAFQIRGHHEQSEITATFTHKKNNFGSKEKDFSVKLTFGGGRVTVDRLEAPRPNPDREPSKKELVQKAVEEMGRATTETVQTKTGLNLQTVRNAVSELIREGALKDTGDKQGQHRIVVTHSHTTKGTGTVTKAQADTSALQYEYEDRDSPPACDVEEFPGGGE